MRTEKGTDMAMFNGDEMRRRLEENLRRLEIQAQVQAQEQKMQEPLESQSNGQQQ
mgnify:CR=1 FL=1